MKNLLLGLCSLMLIYIVGCQANANASTNDYMGQKTSVTGNTNAQSAGSLDKTFDLPAFHGISNSINADVSVSKGGQQSVEVEGDQYSIDRLDLTVKEGILYIRFMKNTRKAKKLDFTIVVPRLDYASITGSGDIVGGGFSDNENLKLKITGSGNIHMDASSSTMEAQITGSGNIHAKGNAQSGSIRITGSGSYKGEGFKLNNAEMRITGSGSAHVRVSEEISGNITGSGSVIDHGDASRVKLKVTGSGRYKQG